MKDEEAIVKQLLNTDTEKTWFEFKVNNIDPKKLGQNVSSICNSCILKQREEGYIVYGINDSKEIVGTNVVWEDETKGNHPLPLWISQNTDPSVHIENHDLELDDSDILLLILHVPVEKPVAFKGKRYIRVGDSTTSLMEETNKERRIWERLSETDFEEKLAKKRLSWESIKEELNIDSYYNLLDTPKPNQASKVKKDLREDGLITNHRGLKAVTNMGAILFAKDLSNYRRLSRKRIRAIKHEDNDKDTVEKERLLDEGYAIAFPNLFLILREWILSSEHLENVFKEEVPLFPLKSLREILINALVQQDFYFRGSGPIVELYKSKVEVSNPGDLLVPKDRLVDHSPHSRNEILASLMRRIDMCEERGSGWDIIAKQIEAYQLPAPDVIEQEDSVKVTVHAPKDFSSLTKTES